MIKIFEEFNELDPYGEDDWEEPSVYEIGMGRDFDIMGYVVAVNENEAKDKAFKLGFFKEDMRRFARTRKVKEKEYESLRRRRNSQYVLAKIILNTLDNSIKEINKEDDEDISDLF